MTRRVVVLRLSLPLALFAAAAALYLTIPGMAAGAPSPSDTLDFGVPADAPRGELRLTMKPHGQFRACLVPTTYSASEACITTAGGVFSLPAGRYDVIVDDEIYYSDPVVFEIIDNKTTAIQVRVKKIEFTRSLAREVYKALASKHIKVVKTTLLSPRRCLMEGRQEEITYSHKRSVEAGYVVRKYGVEKSPKTDVTLETARVRTYEVRCSFSRLQSKDSAKPARLAWQIDSELCSGEHIERDRVGNGPAILRWLGGAVTGALVTIMIIVFLKS